MEIRCTQCNHLGAAGGVQPVEGGVGLVCAECGHVNVVAMGGTPAGSSAGESRGQGKRTVKAASSKKDSKREKLIGEMMERLLPEPGRGPRCRKCAHLLDPHSAHCSRCGLSVADGSLYDEGDAPWEKAPRGREVTFAQAQNLWGSIRERGSTEKIADFVDFMIEEGLVEVGVRKLQHYLVDHPDNPQALEGLERLARKLEQNLTVVRSRAKASAQNVNEEVKRVRSRLLKTALIFWGIILVLLSVTFWDKF